MFLAIVTTEYLEWDQICMKTAFLNGEWTRAIFMTHPEDYVHHNYPDYFCKRRMTRYGLKQALSKWFEKMNGYLCEDLRFKMLVQVDKR